jgi:hypothetical protein
MTVSLELTKKEAKPPYVNTQNICTFSEKTIESYRFRIQ